MLNNLSNGLLTDSELSSTNGCDDLTASFRPCNDNIESTSKAQDAFNSLPIVIQDALTYQKRIVFMANNPSIKVESLERLLQPTDIVLLFNDFIHTDYFTNNSIARQLPKLIFFRQNGDSMIHFGLPPRSNNVCAIDEMAKHAPLGLLFSNQPYQFPMPGDDPKPNDDPITANRNLTTPKQLTQLLRDERHCRVLSEQHSVVADYPYFSDIHSSAPSSGFLLYRLLLAARQHVQLLQPEAIPLKILMLGFNDDNKTAHFWSGHNWQFERQEMSAAPADVQLIRQY